MAETPIGEHVKLLMLEDNRADAKLALRELTQVGYKIDSEIVSSSSEFIDRVKSQQYDLIIADYNLPSWTGIEAVRWLRSAGYNTPLILFTGTLGDDLAVECIKEGATDYVLKDKVTRLPHAIRRALEEDRLRSERDRAEKELRESEEQYRLLFETNPLPMWVWEKETKKFLAVNETAVSHYGFSRSEFFAMTGKDLNVKQKKGANGKLFSRKAARSNIHLEKHRKKNGDLIDVELTSNRIVFQKKDGDLVLAHDITELRRNQEELRQSEERFAKAFRSNPLAMSITTLQDGTYLDVNEAFVQLLGYPRVDAIGRTAATELNIWANREDRDAMILQLAQNGRVMAFEAKLRTAAGDVKLTQISAEPVELDGIKCVLAIAFDVTEARKLEEQFRQAQKMEAIGRLAGGVAHDFNNMLGVITGYSEILMERVNNVPVRKGIEEIKKAAERAAALTRQLLAFSRQQVLLPRVLNLNAIIDNLSKMLRHMIGEDVELLLEKSPDLGRVKADMVQIEQIIMNLAVNARDAMPKGGQLTIETANVDLDSSELRGREIHPGRYVLLSVRDTGSGISEKDMVHIFDPFFTTKSPGKGTGLGLSTVYGIVKQSGGFVSVISKVGEGATFEIYLPRVEEAEIVEDFGTPGNIEKGTETILLVEDEEGLRKVMLTMLEDCGYTVLEAADGQDAIAVANQHTHQIDLLLTDVVMPGLSGSSLVSSLRVFRPDIKLLYVSGYTNDLLAQHGASGEKVTLLGKPFTKQALLSKVRLVLDGNRRLG